MFEIHDILISDDLYERKFLCDLNSCKGACCVEGDSGAPLEEEECSKLEEIFSDVRPYMRPEGIKAVQEQGVFVVDSDNDLVTPLVNNRECAYVYFAKDGGTRCAIESAYKEGKIDWKKPISCELFPVRVTEYPTFTAVNVQFLDICESACSLGKALEIPVYKFLKDPLIKRFGKEWYTEMEKIAGG
ncbi:MAG: hypothetical protein CMP67_08475 [Flavobacteriales bacterium]|nr:hypothetical protein [Flavobacteriales bacterium]MBO73290.1 hypothetical protein [Flavobacteriales bacterium]